MPVADGQPVDAATTNPAFLDAQVDDVAQGRIGLENTVPASGFFVASVQRYLNTIAQVIGLAYTANYTAEADTTARDYNSTSNAVTNGDTTKQAVKKLADKFADTTAEGGHNHDGSDGNGVRIAYAALTGVRAGSGAISSGSDTVTVTFSSSLPTVNYAIGLGVRNTVDFFPIFLSAMITSKSTSGFTVKFNAPTDTANYLLEWVVTENV